MKKVLIITYYWPPAGGAGVQRWLKFCKYLPEFGVSPVVLTVDPAYAAYPQIDNSLVENVHGNIEVIHTKSFEPLNFYGKIAGKGRVPYGGFSNAKTNSKFSKFVRGNFFIPDARKGWNLFVRKKALEIIENSGIDTVITTGPPHSTHLVGSWIKQRTRVKWVVDLRDPWTDIYYNQEMLRTPWAKRNDLKLEKKVLKSADICITVSYGFKELFESKVPRLYHVITNGFDSDDKKTGNQNVSKSEKFVVMYLGTIAESYRPSSILKMFSELPLNFEFRIAGNLPEGLRLQIEDSSIQSKLNLLGYLPHTKVHHELDKADVLLLIIPEVKNSNGIIPGKLFEYLATGKPILAITEDREGDVTRILAETNRGRCFKRSDIDGVKHFLMDLAKSETALRDAKAKKSIQEYDRRKLTEELVKIIKQDR